MSEPEVLVIGAGISGLSTAWWLAQQGIEVEVWEAASKPGGKIRSNRSQGYLTESAAGLLVNFRADVDRMIDGCGLTHFKQQRPEQINRYVLYQEQLRSVPMSIPGMMRSPLWSRQGKLRMLLEGLIPGKGVPGESVSSFISRRFGDEMLHRAIDPFVTGTLASDPDLAEAASVLPRLKALESRYGSITLGILINKLWKRRRINVADTFSFSEGMAQLTETLATTPGVHIRYQMNVNRVRKKGCEWQAEAEGPFGSTQKRCRQLILTTPAPISGQWLADIDRSLGNHLRTIQYAPLAVLHMGFDQNQLNHPLDGTGFLAGKRDRVKLNGNLWMSSLFKQRAPNGRVLVTSYLGGMRNPQQVRQSEASLVEQTLSSLRPLMGIEDEPEFIRIDRHHQGLPLYHGCYQDKLEAIQHLMSAHPGLHLCGNYAGGVSVRERIYQGRIQAEKVANQLKARRERFANIENSPISTARAL